MIWVKQTFKENKGTMSAHGKTKQLAEESFQHQIFREIPPVV